MTNRNIVKLLRMSLAAVLAGAISALAFAPWDWWLLAALGIAVLLALLHASTTALRAAGMGWLFGVGHFCVSLSWIAKAFTFQSAMPPAMGWVAVAGLSMFLALYPALAAGAARLGAQRRAPMVLVLAASWMLAEWLRGWVLTGFAWNPLGAAWLPVADMARLAALIGSLGLSGLMVLAGGAFWLQAPGTTRRERLAGTGIAGALLLAGLLAPTAGPAKNAPARTPGPTLIVVQPNIGQDEKYDPAAADRHLRQYIDMSARALARLGPAVPGRGAIVIWPEGAVLDPMEPDEALRRRLATALRPGDLLLTGGTGLVANTEGRLVAYANSLFAMDSMARLVGRYDKAHLVPLGEYVPARALMARLGLARLVPGNYDFAAGPGPRTLGLPGFPATGPMVCYEIIFPGAVVDPRNRPAWLANVSNDAWYGPTGPPQHLAQARLRAIEEGLPIVRSTPTGVSGVIDAAGVVRATIGLGVAGTVTAALPPPLPPTPFARSGHVLPGLLGLLLLSLGIAADRRKII
ncbi:apolipoprotein N-acyltransferase [Sandarakinorhabdus sp.]|uniref:apolipoprotein N-acyltransferase n=1 Tax=Sandarakinorhabdus sp. TaxID=1916663 RepID=UPI00286DD39D|nr:apolipoprotein N-acyltransferase [Sandarakinorhabdus sp.]